MYIVSVAVVVVVYIEMSSNYLVSKDIFVRFRLVK